jgi:hypothetical protein
MDRTCHGWYGCATHSNWNCTHNYTCKHMEPHLGSSLVATGRYEYGPLLRVFARSHVASIIVTITKSSTSTSTILFLATITITTILIITTTPTILITTNITTTRHFEH